MKSMLKTALTLCAVTASFSPMAASPDWNLVEAGYFRAFIDDTSVEPDGFGVAGSALINDNIFAFASYSMLSASIFSRDVDLDQASLGLGYRFAANETTDVYGAVSYEYLEASTAGRSEDDNGYGLTVGVRTRITQWELDANLSYIDIDGGSETALGLGANYYINKQFAVGVNYQLSDDVDVLGATVRYAF